MLSQDVIKMEFRNKMVDALKGENADEFVGIISDFAENLHKSIMDEVAEYQETQNATILANRGIRQLTPEERNFFKAFAKAAATGDIEKEFAGIEAAYPQSFIESVSMGLRSSFELLDAVDLNVSSTVTKMIVNGQEVQLAEWGELGSAITKRLDGKVKVFDITAKKLAAVLPVSMDMVEAGPEWVEAYVLRIIIEAVGQAICYAIVKGKGKTEPIGMICDCSKSASVVDGEYPYQTPIAISDLSCDTLSTLFAELATDETGRARVVNEAIMVVNPIDYYKNIVPAVTVRTGTGDYVTRTALPVKFIQEASLERGEAAFGIGKQYFLGIVIGAKTGKITFSDDAEFAEDMRVYKNKLLGNGRPKDSTSFIRLDINELTPASIEVNIMQPTKFKVRLFVTPKTIAQVAVADANGESVGACIVDTGTGSVFIPALENGMYTLTVAGEGYESKVETFDVNGGAVDLGTVSITKSA